ncbi:unnamed protein product [Closterium sp. Yama58-4]|nr:unnamed protein product [Closterium sp. Yama58-4]
MATGEWLLMRQARARARERGVLVADLVEEGQSVTVARGGQGGRGNACMGRVKPWQMEESDLSHEKGSAGSRAVVALELKTVADVGLVGLPNAGKSSLLRALSRAKPRVGWYPFTTLHPQLGTVKVGGEGAWEGDDGGGGWNVLGAGEARGDGAWGGDGDEENEGDEDVLREDGGFVGGGGLRGLEGVPGGEMGFTVADIPGLIGGAHRDRGLGLSFLRHVERTKGIVYVLDMSGSATGTVSGDLGASEPGATEPSATEPIATEPIATEPIAIEPSATGPSTVSAGALPPGSSCRCW